MKLVYFTFILVVLMVLSFFSGSYASGLALEKNIDQLQATISFHHLSSYQKVEKDVSSGCLENALKRLDWSVSVEKIRMAKFIQNGSSQEFDEYVLLRDKELMKELHDFDLDVSMSREMVLPACENKQ